jgi:hypothetical protein
MKLSNSTFQWIWFKVLKRFYYPKQNKVLIGVELLEYYADYMLAYISWAKKLTDLQCAVFGDSNGQEMHDHESMRRFARPSVNISISGTRTDDWNVFFLNTDKGKLLFHEIRWLPNVLINLGGNNILQGKFDILETELKVLNSLIKNPVFITIPYIYADLTSKLIGKSKDAILNEIVLANEWIKQYPNIDITPYTGKDGTPYFFTHKDLVHFTDDFDYTVRIPLINKTLWSV